jgi:hypothetical protein
MSVTSKGLLLAAAFLAGCIDCEGNEGACFTSGEATADLSGEQPVLAVEGLTDESRVPNALTVYACEDGHDGWQVGNLPVPRVTYGELPAGAEEAGGAQKLKEGKQYTFAFEFRDSSPFTKFSGLAPLEWSGTFTHGDPDSFQPSDDHCMYSNGETTTAQD